MEAPLVIRTCPTSGKLKSLLVLGLVIEMAAVGLFVLSMLDVIAGDWFLVLVIGFVLGMLLQVSFVLCYARSHAFIFDGEKRTIVERRAGGERHDVGSFDVFKGVDVVAQVRESALTGTELHELHQTYPDQSLMTYDVCLVSKTQDPIHVVQIDDRRKAGTLQGQIVKYCGWGHSGSSIPDSNRELPQEP